MIIKEHLLIQTCGACPEQYDVILEDKIVGYLRLRHGRFYASVPYVEGEKVYESYPEGDGVFSPEERESELTNAIDAIIEYRSTNPVYLSIEESYKL